MNDDNELVLYNTYYNNADAYIDKGVLETNGVPCVITNEIISNVYPVAMTPQGAIRLWINRQDADLACRIMHSHPLPHQRCED